MCIERYKLDFCAFKIFSKIMKDTYLEVNITMYNLTNDFKVNSHVSTSRVKKPDTASPLVCFTWYIPS